MRFHTTDVDKALGSDSLTCDDQRVPIADGPCSTNASVQTMIADLSQGRRDSK